MNVDMTIRRDIVDMHVFLQETFAVGNHKGLTGFLVEVHQTAVRTVENHIHQRGVEHRLIL